MWDGSVPEDEFWVKVGGDHGDHSFKFSFHLVNVMHPNSLHNTIPFFVCASKDSPSNLSTAFQLYTEQIQTFKTTKCKGKQIKISLFGDHHFQARCDARHDDEYDVTTDTVRKILLPELTPSYLVNSTKQVCAGVCVTTRHTGTVQNNTYEMALHETGLLPRCLLRHRCRTAQRLPTSLQRTGQNC